MAITPISKIVSFRYRLCFIHLFLSTVLYSLIIIFDLREQYSMMTTYGVYSAVVFAILLISELRQNGIGLLAIYLAFSYLRLILPTIQMSLYATEGIKFSYQHDYTDYIFPCSVAMNMYYMLFIIGLTYFAKEKSLSLNLEKIFVIRHISIYITILFLIGLVAQILSDILLIFGNNFFSLLSALSSLAIMLLAFNCAYSEKRSLKRLFVFFIVVEEIYAIFFGFYKGNVVFPLCFYLLYYYLHCRNKGKKLLNSSFVVSVLLTMLFIFYFVYPFMTIKRDEAQWDPTIGVVNDNYSTIDIIQRVLNGEEGNYVKEGNYGKGSKSEAISDRQNALTTNTYFYMSAIKNGYQQRIINNIFIYFVPKWLGGEGINVTNAPGSLATSYLRDGNFSFSEDEYATFSNIGMFGSGYFYGGWIATLLLCMFNAWLIASLLNYSLNNTRNVFALIIFTQIVSSAISCYEEVADGGLYRAKTWLLYYILSIMLNIVVLWGKGIRQTLKSSSL